MKLFITSFLFILFSGCTKDVYDPSNKIPGEGTNPFSKVTISSNFDWSMIQISHLTVQSFDPYDGTYNYLVEDTLRVGVRLTGVAVVSCDTANESKAQTLSLPGVKVTGAVT